jgi:intracellular septation protein
MVAQHILGGIVSGGTVTSEIAPTLLATATAIIATFAQVLYMLLRRRKVGGMLWLSLAVIVVMGGLTIALHDENFIKWKPTILYWALGIAIVIELFGFKRNTIRKAMEAHLKLPDAAWTRVSLTWAMFFLAMGILNLCAAFIVFKGNTEAWVKFKLFGAPALTFVFIVTQNVVLGKHIQKNA